MQEFYEADNTDSFFFSVFGIFFPMITA